jgi:hypothetical protein
MSLSDLTDPQAVLSAIAEFDAIGREAFLAKYGFKEARHYFVLREGKRYDSKALAGAAHGFQFPSVDALTPSDFSGGDATVARRLAELGFEVTGRPRHLDEPLYPSAALARVIGNGPHQRAAVIERFWAYVIHTAGAWPPVYSSLEIEALVFTTYPYGLDVLQFELVRFAYAQCASERGIVVVEISPSYPTGDVPEHPVEESCIANRDRDLGSVGINDQVRLMSFNG